MNPTAFLICLVATIASTSTSAQEELIDNSEITVSGTLCYRCSVPPDERPPAHTIDDNIMTFWHGEDNLQMGETNELVYEFRNPLTLVSLSYEITRIDFFDNYTDQYNLGELSVQYLDDNGSWVTFRNIPGDYNPQTQNGDFTITPNIPPTTGIRLYMMYQGRGAHGGSPAFYLSEIDFYGTPAPEPLVIDIDIKPGNKRNVINPRARGGIWVAALSSSEFDAREIDASTVRFGPNEAKVIQNRVRDVNRDGLDDLKLYFRIPQTGIACGDTEATLIGGTLDGQRIIGSDSIRTVGCR